MITGDNWVTARMIANGLGIRHVTAEVRAGLYAPDVGRRDERFYTLACRDVLCVKAMATMQA